jgi:phage terminase large subunit-like protein
MASALGPDRAQPLEVQRAVWLAAGRSADDIELAAWERELDGLSLWRRARARDMEAIDRIARAEDEFDGLLALADGLNAAVREDPDCDGYLLDADGLELTSESFDLSAWLRERLDPFGGIDTPLLCRPRGRRALTECDPLLFALIYLPHHLKTVLPGQSGEGVFSFADFHLDVCRRARPSVQPVVEVRGPRDCYVAPRHTGKTTWLYLLIAMWEAAHGHENFIAAFSDSATQAEIHLMTFRQELENNELLRQDFPDLCKPAVKLRAKTDSDGNVKESGLSLKDNEAMYIASSGFVFAARGVDTKTLGLKVNERRPSKLLLDDVEPDESNYSQDQVGKRLRSIIDAILPLNLRARVTIVGTVVMPGSIIHQLVEFERYPETEETPETAWIREQAIRVHYYAPIIDTFDEASGVTGRRSIWPAKWPLAFLESLEATRDYLKNFANDPMGSDGTYWTSEDFGTHRVSAELQAQTLAAITHQLLAIDPAVTTKKKSDFTALAVVGFSAVTRRCVIREAWAVRVQAGRALCALIERIVAQFPQIRGIVIESNQGGDVWLPILGDLGLPIETVWHSAPKEVRAATLLDKYQRGGRVFHERPLRALEQNMVVFPRGAHDDLVDVTGTGVEWFLDRPAQRKRGGGRAVPYA